MPLNPLLSEWFFQISMNFNFPWFAVPVIDVDGGLIRRKWIGSVDNVSDNLDNRCAGMNWKLLQNEMKISML